MGKKDTNKNAKSKPDRRTENAEKDAIYSDFAYDDAFRTMEGECDDLVIPLLNYFFQENFDSTAEIIRLRNEHFIEHGNHLEDKRITDSHLEILAEDIRRRYHIECESGKYDDSLLLKLFEYDTQIAVDSGQYADARLSVDFPNSGILMLRAGRNMPHTAVFEINTPNGSVSYNIPILYESDFSLDKIFGNRLYFMLPFYIFNLEKKFDIINGSKRELDRFSDLLRKISERLEGEVKEGNLSVFSHSVVVTLIHKVAYKLTLPKQKINERVDKLMGGKVLELEVIKAHREGRSEGWTDGVDASVRKLAAYYRENDASLSEKEAVEMAAEILR